MSDCLCGTGRNLGQPDCTGTIERPVKLGFTNRIGSDGVANELSIADTLDASFFTALINQADHTKKLYPTGTIKNVVNERGDPITYSADNVEYFAAEGNRTLTFEIIEGASPILAGALNSMRCKDMGVYIYTLASQIVGNGRVDGKLKPLRIEKNTLYAKYEPKTNDNVERIMITFTFSVLEKDADISYFNYTEDGTGAGVLSADPLDFRGLIDVTMGAATDITTTTFTIPMTYIYGGMIKTPFEGGLLADFTAYNVTDSSSITITSVTETGGSYAFVVPTLTAADVVRITFAKTGFQSTNILTLTVPS